MESYDISAQNRDSDFFQLLPGAAGFFSCVGGVYHSLYANDAFTLFIGKPAEEAAENMTSGRFECFHPEDLPRISLMMYKAGVSGGNFRETARIRGKDNKYTWVEINMNASQMSGGFIFCMFMTNINTRMERQNKLDKTYTKLLGVMNNSPGGIAVFDTINDRTIVASFVSEGMYKLLRGTPDEIANLYRNDPFKSVHPDERDSVIRMVEDALRNLSGFQTTVRLRTLTGDYVWVSASGTIDKVDNQRILYMSFVGSSEDTELLHIQKQILDNFVRRQYDYICYIDGRHNSYKVINTPYSHEKFLSSSGDDFDGDMSELIMETVVPEERENLIADMKLERMMKRLESEEDFELYCTVLKENGAVAYKRIWISPIDKESGTIALVNGDVTAEHRRNEESREALRTALLAAQQANSAKSEFLSRMSHDIRTPLNAIIGYTSMSLEDPSISDRVREYLEKTDSSSKFLLSLINDILNMSRIESGKLTLKEEPFRLADFIESISAIVASQCSAKNILYTCSVGAGMHCSYIGDTLKLQQILFNIIGNSVKFTPDGGKISFYVSEIHRDMASDVCFVVKDTGCGISAEFLPYIFDSFSQERKSNDNENKGSGLGLAICRSLVNMMNGTISVKSEQKKGSEFTIEIPLRIPDESDEKCIKQDQTSQGYEEVGDFGGRHILLAEDNEMNTEIAKHILEKVNLVVDTAKNGKEACERFNASDKEYYSAILMDIRMPVMDGIEATKKIRASKRRDNKVPIIAMSANAFEEDIRKAINSGVNAYTIKPIEVQQLYAAIRKFIK